MEKFNKKLLIPNSITIINLLLGFLSIVAILEGDILRACWFIIFAMIFDGLDGKVARQLGAYSNFGKELDSFCDLISFGVSPAILIFFTIDKLIHFKLISILIAFLFILSGVIRLARFNITIDTSGEKGDFVGMPIPTAAGLVTSYYIFCEALGRELISTNMLIVLIIFSSLSMVSNVKYKNLVNVFCKCTHIRLISFLVLILIFFIEYLLFPAFVLYTVINNYKMIKSKISILYFSRKKNLLQ